MLQRIVNSRVCELFCRDNSKTITTSTKSVGISFISPFSCTEILFTWNQSSLEKWQYIHTRRKLSTIWKQMKNLFIWSWRRGKRRTIRSMVYMFCNRNYMIDRFMTSKSWNNRSMTSKSWNNIVILVWPFIMN
jgi:hypothetical protein